MSDTINMMADAYRRQREALPRPTSCVQLDVAEKLLDTLPPGYEDFRWCIRDMVRMNNAAYYEIENCHALEDKLMGTCDALAEITALCETDPSLLAARIKKVIAKHNAA